MGDYLSVPEKTKNPTNGFNHRLRYGACGMQGWRKEMEDSHIHNLSFDDNIAVFGVFDGHGGKEVAIYVKKHLENEIKLAKKKFNDWSKILSIAFEKLDKKINSKEGHQELEALASSSERNLDGEDIAATMGCTACVAVITQSEIYVANIGDSRAVLCNKTTALDMSIDHKPEVLKEKIRIEKANGFVENNRVNGALNLARSFGDFQYKSKENLKPEDQMVIPIPDVKMEPITSDTNFLIIACDGIWDVKTSQEAVDFVLNKNTETNPNKKLSNIVEDLFENCIAKEIGPGGKGCDNMTCILVEFIKK